MFILINPIFNTHLDRDPLPWTETLLDRDPLDSDPPGQRPPWTENPPCTEAPWTETLLDSDPLDREPPLDRGPPWTVTPWTEAHPPWTEAPLDRDPTRQRPIGQRSPLDRDPPGQWPPRQRIPWTETPPTETPPYRDPSPTRTVTSGRYASYWNAFLWYKWNCLFMCWRKTTTWSNRPLLACDDGSWLACPEQPYTNISVKIINS